jgi:hypothetical protein
MGQGHNTQRYLEEYLEAFHVYHVDDDSAAAISIWLSQQGRQYRDWVVLEGRMYESSTFVHIKNPKVCFLFEVAFSQHIIKRYVDRKGTS